MDEPSPFDNAPAIFLGAGGREGPFGFPLAFGAEGPFPAEDVEASLDDVRLQERERENLSEGQRRYLDETRDQAITTQGLNGGVRWIYFCSPTWTWKALCGRAGWLLYDPETKAQHAFQLTVMN